VENLFRLRVEAGESQPDRLTFVDDGGPQRESSLAILVQWRDPTLRAALESVFDGFVRQYREAGTIVSPGSFLERVVQSIDAVFGEVEPEILDRMDLAVALCCGRGLYLLHSTGFEPNCELDGHPQPLVSSMRVRVKDLSPSGIRGGHMWSDAVVDRLRLLRVFFEDDDRATLWLVPRAGQDEFADDPFADTQPRLVVEKQAADAGATIGAALDSGWPDLEAGTRRDRSTLSYVAHGLVVLFFSAALFGMWRWQRAGRAADAGGADALFSEAVDASLPSRAEQARVSSDDVVARDAASDRQPAEEHDGELAVLWSKPHRDWVTSSPRPARDRVVYGCRDGHLYAVGRDGEVAWDYPSGAGIGATPAVADGRVFCGNYAGRAFAVRDKDGDELWTADLGSRIVASPTVGKKRVFFVTQGGELVALRQKDGRLEWRQALGGKLRATPLAHGDLLFVPGGGGELVCYEQDSGQVRWTFDAGSLASSPLMADGRLVFGCKDGTVHAISAKDGTALWSVRTKGAIQGTPAVGDDFVYVGSGDRRLYAVRLATGDVAWAFPTKAAILASPCVEEGRVYITAYDQHTYVVDGETGREIAKLRLKAPIFSSPLVVAGRIYCGSNDGTLYCMSDVR
jgi:outer membrane protein assembly factor BamB